MAVKRLINSENREAAPLVKSCLGIPCNWCGGRDLQAPSAELSPQKEGLWSPRGVHSVDVDPNNELLSQQQQGVVSLVLHRTRG